MRRRKNTKRVWVVIIVASLLALSLLGYIFKRPIIYYAKIAYHKVYSINKPPKASSTNKKTNLVDGIFIPKAKIYGIDISRHQGVVNWELLSKFKFKYHKISFAYIKATESNDWKDKQFDRNWKQAKKYGITRGAYHFFDPHEDVNKQMQHFFKEVKLKIGDLPPMLDVEQESRITTNEYRKRVKNCLELMEKHYKIKPILYINQNFYNSYFSTSDFTTYPLWISRLKKKPPKQENWILWQFSHTAIIPGISEYVDLNAFKGSEADFKILLKK